MPKVLAAVTLPINPPASSPVLTIPQIWAGLIIKCREPQQFVAAMSDCRVTSETETQIMRIITIGKDGAMGPAGTELQERIELTKPIQVCFEVFRLVRKLFSGLDGCSENVSFSCRPCIKKNVCQA